MIVHYCYKYNAAISIDVNSQTTLYYLSIYNRIEDR